MFLREVDTRLTVKRHAHSAVLKGASVGITHPKHRTGAELHNERGKEENTSNS